MAESPRWEELRRQMQRGVHDISHCIPRLKYIERQLARFPIRQVTSDLAEITEALEHSLDQMSAALDDYPKAGG